MSSDVFQKLGEIYNDGVKKADSKGYAEILKACTEAFFDAVNESVSFYNEGNEVHFSDIEYLDGYFIFAHGTNSVVHFHIDECPGWKFGIWWTPHENRKNTAEGKFFAQFEETIDKFKPSASTIEHSFQACLENDRLYVETFSISRIIRFIINEPALAFCRDYCYWDYNAEYHTREEAIEVFQKYRRTEDERKRYTKEADEKILSFVKEKVLPLFKNAKIIDLGDGRHPRCDIVAPYEDNMELVQEPGCYELFDREDPEQKELFDTFRNLQNEAENYAAQHDFYYFTPLHDSITFTKKEGSCSAS